MSFEVIFHTAPMKVTSIFSILNACKIVLNPTNCHHKYISPMWKGLTTSKAVYVSGMDPKKSRRPLPLYAGRLD